MVIYLPGPDRGRRAAAGRTDSARDRARTGQARGRAGGGQARRGDRAAQSHPPPEAAARDGRRGDAQEHPHDRPHGRRQDRTGAPPGAAGQFAVPEGGSQQVHRGGLRGPRRGIDDPRPGGYLHRHGAGRAAGRSGGPRRSQRRGAPARSADAAARRSRARARNARAKSCASACAKASWTSAWWKSKSRTARPSFEITTNAGIEEMGINLKDMLPNLFGQKTRTPQDARGRSAGLPGAGRGAASSSTWTR